jgi:hypothetical protein
VMGPARRLTRAPQRMSKAQLLADVEAFCTERGLGEHQALFARAALVAREPRLTDGIDEISAEEKEALSVERAHPFKGSFWLWFSVIVCAVGAAYVLVCLRSSLISVLTNGQCTGMGPDRLQRRKPVLPHRVRDRVPDGLRPVEGRRDQLGHFPLRRRHRRVAVRPVQQLTPIGSGLAQSWQGLFAARFVLGIGLGMKNACVAVYSSEMAPARVRGALVMFWQIWVTFGRSYGFDVHGHSLTLVLVRYLPRIRRQLDRQGCRQDHLAPPARLGLYPGLAPR